MAFICSGRCPNPVMAGSILSTYVDTVCSSFTSILLSKWTEHFDLKIFAIWYIWKKYERKSSRTWQSDTFIEKFDNTPPFIPDSFRKEQKISTSLLVFDLKVLKLILCHFKADLNAGSWVNSGRDKKQTNLKLGSPSTVTNRRLHRADVYLRTNFKKI